MTEGRTPSLLRARAGSQRVTNVELFFDLVYVFAVTQLSHHLLSRPTVDGALQTGLLLAMVWLVWSYTTWVTNWLDPDRIPVRLMLVGLMLISLVMSAAIPEAFGARGLWIGASYAASQVGRSAFAVWALRGEDLQRNFERIFVWCLASGALAVAGGFSHGYVRGALWLLAVGVDLLGGAAGFYVPGLGRSRTSEWTIEGNHFAERCQSFVLIALGESIVVIGATLSNLADVTNAQVGAFFIAFVGAVALWWIYFDRSASESALVIGRSADPGRLGRSAYHFIHPIMIAGIIVIAAGDDRVLTDPLAGASTATAWMVLGGAGLFLAGHAAFKAVVWRVVSWPRLGGIAVLGLLGLLAPHASALALGSCAAAVVIGVAVADRLLPVGEPGSKRTGHPERTSRA